MDPLSVTRPPGASHRYRLAPKGDQAVVEEGHDRRPLADQVSANPVGAGRPTVAGAEQADNMDVEGHRLIVGNHNEILVDDSYGAS
jgi:hypothetical protein